MNDEHDDEHDQYAELEQKVAYKGGGMGYKGLDPNGYRYESLLLFTLLSIFQT